MANGVYTIDAATFQVSGFRPTGKGALYIARDSRLMFITNRGEGSISVLDLATGQIIAKWLIPGGGSPDMGNILSRRLRAVADRTLQRSGVRNQHPRRPPNRKDPSRNWTSWPDGLAAAGPLLARPHRHPALIPTPETDRCNTTGDGAVPPSRFGAASAGPTRRSPAPADQPQAARLLLFRAVAKR